MQKTAEEIADELLGKALGTKGGAGKTGSGTKSSGTKSSGTKSSGTKGSGVVTMPSPAMPMAVARLFVAQRCLDTGVLTLHHWRGGWWQWRMSHWCEIEDREVRSLLYAFTENARYRNAEGNLSPWAPTRHKIGDLLEALAAITILRNDIDQPCWLDGRESGTIVAVGNGLLEVETRRLLVHSPIFFNQTAVPFDYDENASEPTCFLDFLDALWPDEPAAPDVLGEWFGYVISGRLDLHKILLMVGPTRGGKGAIARILTALIGRANVAGPTLNSLGGEFGMAPLIGKSLAVISDARFVGKNSNIVVERLLSISGEDTLTVNRKYRDQWTGKLPSRLHVISNELPKLGDASTAIVGRIVLLPLSLSWLGKEDHSLESKLHAELPGILNWSLDGLERLVDNDGRFSRVESAEEAIVAMRDLASPVAAFVREKCEKGANKDIIIDVLYAAYKEWCEDNGHVKPTKQTFGRDLRAVVPTIRPYRPRDGADRRRRYRGIALRPANAPAQDEEDDAKPLI
jgi:putative DNA primase/helicase